MLELFFDYNFKFLVDFVYAFTKNNGVIFTDEFLERLGKVLKFPSG